MICQRVFRPTSETIIWNTYKDWVSSYRDLPILVNQWANVVRREMRTRIFLRTAEFLRQEGHTAHATEQEAIEEANQMLDVYNDIMTNWLAISGIPWRKSPSERFAWAVDTLTIEAMMKDWKALQSCTSHFLGQNFAKAFDVKFTNDKNEDELVRATSRWMSTRIMWWLIMSHSDNEGLVLPPAVAPLHVVIVPIAKTEEDLTEITEYLFPLFEALENSTYDISSEYHTASLPITYKIDDDDQKSPGWKFSQWEMKWVPIRVAVGKRDMANWVLEVARRDTGEKVSLPIAEAWAKIVEMLYDIQSSLLEKNIAMRTENTVVIDWVWSDALDKLSLAVDEKKFVLAHWDGTDATEALIKDNTWATIRCIPFTSKEEEWVCIYTGKPSSKRVLFAKAY